MTLKNILTIKLATTFFILIAIFFLSAKSIFAGFPNPSCMDGCLSSGKNNQTCVNICQSTQDCITQCKSSGGGNTCEDSCTRANMVDLKAPSGWLGKVPVPEGIPQGGLSIITENIVPFVIGLLVFIIIVASLIFLLIGGISWIASSGNKEGMAKARNTVTYAIIGLILGLGSFIFLNITLQFLGVIPQFQPFKSTPVNQRGQSQFNSP